MLGNKTQHAKNQQKSRVVTGSGTKRKQKSALLSRSISVFLLIVFVLSFSFIGYRLLHSSSAEVYVSGPTNVTVASWNAMKDNKKNDATEVKALLTKADVIGLQEIHVKKQRQRMATLIKSKAYDGYPSKLPKNDNDNAASCLIVWKQTSFQLVKAGKTGKVSAATKDLRARYITWVKLRSIATGQQFYVVNTHMIKYVDNAGVLTTSHPTNVSRYTGHIQKLVALLRTFQKDNVPVFVTGDFAVDYRTDDKGTSIFPKAALGSIGFRSNWDLTGLSGIDPTANTYGGAGTTRLIDYVFASSEVTAPITSIDPSHHGSDHAPVYLTVTIPRPTGVQGM